MNRFSIGLWCATNSWFYTTTGEDQLSGWTEKKVHSTSQSHTCTKKKVMVIVWWSHLSHYSFLNPGEIISEKCAQQINEMHQKLQHLQPAVVNRKGPILFHNNTRLRVTRDWHFPSWKNWATKFCLIHHIHLTSCRLTTTTSSISTTFCREDSSTSSRRQKMLSRNLSNPTAWVFSRYENKETYFSLAKMCWL